MIEGIDQRQGRGAIQGSAVVESRGDAHRCFIHIGDAEVDFPHIVTGAKLPTEWV